MLHFTGAMLCKQVIEDRRTRQISLIEIADRMKVDLPRDHPSEFDIRTERLVLASLWANTDMENELEMTLELIRQLPSGKEYGNRATHDFKMRPGGGESWFIQLNSVRLAGPGFYPYILRYKVAGSPRWKRAATILLKVDYNYMDDAVMTKIDKPDKDDES